MLSFFFASFFFLIKFSEYPTSRFCINILLAIHVYTFFNFFFFFFLFLRLGKRLLHDFNHQNWIAVYLLNVLPVKKSTNFSIEMFWVQITRGKFYWFHLLSLTDGFFFIQYEKTPEKNGMCHYLVCVLNFAILYL